MTTKEILKLILQIFTGGGIVALDAVAIVFMFLQGKSYLTEMPSVEDYVVYNDPDRRTEEIDKDKLIWRDMASKIYAWLPWIILTSLLLVGLAVILCAHFGAGGGRTPQG